MKRKLISFDTFKKIEETSLTNAQRQLVEAEQVLAKNLGIDAIKLHTFGESDVTYQTSDGNFIHATYAVNNDQIILENIEILIIEEESERLSARETISNMIDSLLESNEYAASNLFESYMSMPFVKRELAVNEATKISFAKKKKSKHPKKAHGSKIRHRIKKAIMAKAKPSVVKEWNSLTENVLGYIDYVNNGNVVRESLIRTDSRGNVVAIALPTVEKLNEGKILNMGFKTMNTELKVIRKNMKKISEDQNFVKAMSDLKRYNNISDNNALEETLEAIVSVWPDILFVTETELSEQIGIALDSANISNFDDSTCSFMAEAILRTAHNAYTDKVRKIGTLAGAKNDVTAECQNCKDSYRDFSEVSQNLFDQLDESLETEINIFTDLYRALNEAHRIAVETGNEATRIEIADFMRECSAIINRGAVPDLELAETIAGYISDLTESEEGWDHDVEVNSTGDHSMTKWNAKQSSVSSNNTGNWRDAAPVSDGKTYNKGYADEMGHGALGNTASSDTWPDIKNPYVPKFIAPKVKEKSISSEDGLGDDQFQNTWPKLNNPLSPKPVMPKMVEGYASKFRSKK
jgi:hypothetical protein